MANLRDLQVELDINQNDFARLNSRQPGMITTDAYGPDRKYRGVIEAISPEANRQKATVQVKVRVEDPDADLRPEMNASVAFYSPDGSRKGSAAKPVIIVPATAVRDGAVFVLVDGKAVRRQVKLGSTTAQGVQIEDGLIGGEDVVVSPPAELKQGQRIRSKQG
jgi:HlyD family secretion protein